MLNVMNLSNFFEKNDQLGPPFCLFSFFSSRNCTEITVDFSGIQTQIVRVDGEHADHLTTTTAP